MLTRFRRLLNIMFSKSVDLVPKDKTTEVLSKDKPNGLVDNKYKMKSGISGDKIDFIMTCTTTKYNKCLRCSNFKTLYPIHCGHNHYFCSSCFHLILDIQNSCPTCACVIGSVYEF